MNRNAIFFGYREQGFFGCHHMNFLRVGHNQNLPNIDAVRLKLIEFLQFPNTEVKFFCNAVQRVLGLNRVTSSQRTRESERQNNCEKFGFHASQFTRFLDTRSSKSQPRVRMTLQILDKLKP